jgi:hypothetical protein
MFARSAVERNDDVRAGIEAVKAHRAERIVDGLLDRGDPRLGRRIETEQVAVLEEKLGNGNLALSRRHFRGRRGFGSPIRHGSCARRPALVCLARMRLAVARPSLQY